MKTNNFITKLCAIALATVSVFAMADSSFPELQALKDGKGNRTGRSEGFRAGIICENDYVSGVTLALASNIDNEAHAFEFAFLVNAADKDSSGFQWNWFWGNYVNDGNFGGVQWALVQNRVGGNMKGWQSAYGMNLVAGNMTGLQGAMFFNYVESGKMTGAQFALVNKVDHDATGLQWGFVNLTDDTMKGVQIGLANFAGTAKGIQLGFYNQADNLYGIQLGLVNRLTSSEKWPYTPFVRVVF